MPMPSLFKYFAFVGAALLGLLSLVNFLLDPSTGATMVSQAAPAKPAAVVEHDPRASKIERWRNEQAALRTAVVTEMTQTAPATTAAAKATVQTPAAQPVAAVAPELAKPAEPAPAAVATPETPAAPQLQTADAAITGVQTDDERAAEAARVKADKAKSAKARKARAEARHARQQAEQGAPMPGNQFYGGSQQRNASNQQDQFYYSQRVSRERQAVNAYAPRQQGFGPFGW
jgi:hypothetical protein